MGTSQINNNCSQEMVFRSSLFFSIDIYINIWYNTYKRKEAYMNWIDKIKQKFDDVYDFTDSVFTKQKADLTVICIKHGKFVTRGESLLRSKACCPSCIKEQYVLRSDKRKKTVMSRYGVENVMQDKDIKESLKTSIKRKYGVSNVMQLSEINEKRVETNIKRFGAKSYIESEEGKRRVAATNLGRYGVSNFMQSDARFDVLAEQKKKSEATQIARYGARHYSQSDDAKSKAFSRKMQEINTKKENGTLNTSDAEKIMFNRLIEYFGEDDVEYQYRSNEYPFTCDFYIKSLDLYIELNAHWTHGGCIFDDSLLDSSQYKDWLAKRGSKYYENALYVWTDLDVRKRNLAKHNNLNYLIFWDLKLRDLEVWLSSGIPLGKDYDAKYSWLKDFDFKYPGEILLRDSFFSVSQIAKKYQFDSFYKREMKMWNENKLKDRVDFRIFILYNRLVYKGKSMNELSGKEILTGISIAGILKAYTVFDNTLMKKFLNKYPVKSIFDPFAGWGERMLTCYLQSIKYQGIDIRAELKAGYDAMIADYNLSDVNFSVCNAEVFDDYEADTIITCPPYYNAEIYGDLGLENKSLEEFKMAITKIFKRASEKGVKYVALQSNQKCKELFIDALILAGFTHIDSIDGDIKKSHLCKNKTEYETLLIFKKK